ncbi:hypothetical protein C4552_00610 [Candidatus Parcubacteria bacterium]|nr:MAG: hypothetical protein C4552_00610 [Candidatus Parcubacteria bacterium]
MNFIQRGLARFDVAAALVVGLVIVIVDMAATGGILSRDAATTIVIAAFVIGMVAIVLHWIRRR